MELLFEEATQLTRFLGREAKPGSRRGRLRVSRCGTALMQVDTATGKNISTLAVLAPNDVLITPDEGIRIYASERGIMVLHVASFTREGIDGAHGMSSKTKEALRWMKGL